MYYFVDYNFENMIFLRQLSSYYCLERRALWIWILIRLRLLLHNLHFLKQSDASMEQNCYYYLI
jgi:hypothetical protein